jgi:hypothetical protein
MSNKQQTAVDWLAEKFNYVTWMRNRDEISAGLADEWRKHYLSQAKEMEEQQHKETFKQSRQAKIFEKDMPPVWESWEQYYNATFNNLK